MASEYLKKKYQDVKPDEPLRLTKQQKIDNWWYYHKVPVLVGIVVLVIAGLFVRDLVTNVRPDYQIAYVSQTPLTKDETAEIVSMFEQLGEDVNGDGKVHIVLLTFDEQVDLPMEYASNIKLTVELASGSNQIFLLQDPVEFQERYGVLMQKDGSSFTEGDSPADCLCYQLQDCPALRPVEKFGELYVARRYAKEQDEAAISSLWNCITAGITDPGEVEE